MERRRLAAVGCGVSSQGGASRAPRGRDAPPIRSLARAGSGNPSQPPGFRLSSVTAFAPRRFGGLRLRPFGPTLGGEERMSTHQTHKSKIAGLSCLLLTLAGHPAAAQESTAKEWPAKPITLVVPFAAGGTTDL